MKKAIVWGEGLRDYEIWYVVRSSLTRLYAEISLPGKTHCQGYQDPSKRVPIFLGTQEANYKMVPICPVPIPPSRTVDAQRGNISVGCVEQREERRREMREREGRMR